jgi:flagellar biosynthetic protein FliR
MPSPLDLSAFQELGVFAPGGAAVTALLVLRLTGLVWIAPVFSGRVVPVSVKTAMVVVLTALMWPAAVSSSAGASITVATVLIELVVGLSLGLGAAIFVGAAESAGDMLAVQMGLSGANVVDPMSQTQLPVLGQFLGLFATALIVSMGGLLLMLGALADSVAVLPLGGPVNVQEGSMAVVQLGGTLLTLGLRFAAPVVAAMMMSNATLGVLARTVPQLNVLMVAFPVQIGVGLFVLAATLPLIATTLTSFPDAYYELSSSVLESFAAVAEGGR